MPVNLNSVDGVSVIVYGLLCSIVKAISRFPNDDDFVSIVGTAEVKEAWHKLFSYFKDVKDDIRKVPIIEIKR